MTRRQFLKTAGALASGEVVRHVTGILGSGGDPTPVATGEEPAEIGDLERLMEEKRANYFKVSSGAEMGAVLPKPKVSELGNFYDHVCEKGKDGQSHVDQLGGPTHFWRMLDGIARGALNVKVWQNNGMVILSTVYNGRYVFMTWGSGEAPTAFPPDGGWRDIVKRAEGFKPVSNQSGLEEARKSAGELGSVFKDGCEKKGVKIAIPEKAPEKIGETLVKIVTAVALGAGAKEVLKRRRGSTPVGV